MPYRANQYNYATPLSSAVGFNDSTSVVADVRYFTLFDNKLDGTYAPVSGDVGLWGSALSTASGYLNEPFVVTVESALPVNAIWIIGHYLNYPVDFTVKLFNDTSELYSETVADNDQQYALIVMPQTYNITHYEISISRISASNAVAMVSTVYGADYVHRDDAIAILASESSSIDVSTTRWLYSNDTASVRCSEASHITNIIDVAHDNVVVTEQSTGELTNVHTRMKEPSRRIYGKVYITYTDPMLSTETEITGDAAYNSNIDQLLDGTTQPESKYFTLYDNDLSGSYVPSDEHSQVGWVSPAVSDASGTFSTPPTLYIEFSPRPIIDLVIYFDQVHGAIARNFGMTFKHYDGSTSFATVKNNTSAAYTISRAGMSDVKAISFTFNSTVKPYMPVAIIDLPVVSTMLYEGYEDVSRLISIDMLEELTYDDDIEALGGISANEVTIAIDNSSKEFYFNNTRSAVAKHLKRNRKIEPWLGVEVIPGQIEWHSLGVYWSYKWNVPTNSLVASVVGFDTLGLLDTTLFTNHQTKISNTIGELLEYILDDANAQLGFIKYNIDSALYNVVIPYAWFDAASHTAALRRISQCYPMHIYCNRAGEIVAAPQKLRLDYYYDEWSDSTNVIDKVYDSLYTTLPNIVNIVVAEPKVTEDALAADELVFDVSVTNNRTLTFNKPYVGNGQLFIDCDSDVSYTYEAFSWGLSVNFTGSGEVRSIKFTGNAVDISQTSTIVWRDDESIRFNGAVKRDIQADFIQSSYLARVLIERISSLSEYDKYDATVSYRGDISLSINDPVLLLNGIAPDNRYNIKRHQLSWNGGLTGSAYLNT